MGDYKILTFINLRINLLNNATNSFEIKNMKKWITAVALLATISINAQMKEGTIVYEKTVNMHRTIPNEQMKAMMPEFRTSKHILLFKDSISVYKIMPEAEAPDPFAGGSGGGMTMRFRGATDGGDLFNNYALLNSIQGNEMGGKNFLISDSLKQQGWKLTDGSKKILGYTCYKAIKQTKSMIRSFKMITSNSETGTSDTVANKAAAPKEIEVIAWYTTDIITPAGPESHSMLPGAILEIDIDNGLTIFKATEVKNTVNLKDLKAPTKGKTVTRSEYQKIVQEAMSQGAGMFQMNRN